MAASSLIAGFKGAAGSSARAPDQAAHAKAAPTPTVQTTFKNAGLLGSAPEFDRGSDAAVACAFMRL
ncbi:hypothetical protein [Rhizobium mesoamericanum]|uniref:hypothetical protein n=1 Tax=Rhizobium mesoamericanum TaxID=1079800 RepID=UPI00030702E5|nr:hypothetical protein [Rhizobium mesoamericanum]